MNAGANGHETCECLESVQYLHEDGTIEDIPRKELKFRYRFSPFQRMNGAILSARFALKPDSKARNVQLKIVDQRMKTQPLKDKSAGCIFRNPELKSAGALIDACSLKGKQIGGAKVSEIHANFIVNTGSATAEDVKALIALVQKQVLEQTGVHLEPEIRIV
jgi:UDP-N-acetylmuramate dehydrogenase